jgi:hypothetical protein
MKTYIKEVRGKNGERIVLAEDADQCGALEDSAQH